MTPIEIVRSYLQAMEVRDLETARGFLADHVEMIFPGGRRPRALEDIVQASSGRYRRIGKAIDGFDVGQTAGHAIVYCRGTLHGEWPDGGAFSGIRFVDRFEISGGRIIAQWVWNDSGEARLAHYAERTDNRT